MNINYKVLAAAVLAVLVLPLAASAQSLTTAQLQAEIQSLMAELQTLEQQLAIQGGSGAWCYTFTTNMGIGGPAGSGVDALRTVLEKEGFSGVSTELGSNQQAGFDESLASAVSAFQEKYRSDILMPAGLSAGTGYVGPATRAKLNALYGCSITPVGSSRNIVVTAPPSGSTFYEGNTYPVSWSATGYSSNAPIEIDLESIDNGVVSGHQVIATVTNTGSYQYTVQKNILVANSNPSTFYFLRVIANQGGGTVGVDYADSGSFSIATGTSKPQSTIGQVQGLTATALGSSVSLSWSAVPVSPGSPAIGVYNVYRSTTPGFAANSGNMIAQVNAVLWTDTSLSGAGTYYYEVAAQDTTGAIGPASSAASATAWVGGGVGISVMRNGAVVSGTSFLVGDSWTFTLQSSQINKQFYLCANKNYSFNGCVSSLNNAPLTTDANGGWNASGQWTSTASAAGHWEEWLEFRDANGNVLVKSGSVVFDVGSSAQNLSLTVTGISSGTTIDAGQPINFTLAISPAGQYDVEYILVPEGTTPTKAAGNGSFYDSQWGGYNLGGFQPNYYLSTFTPTGGITIPWDIPAGSYHLALYLFPWGASPPSSKQSALTMASSNSFNIPSGIGQVQGLMATASGNSVVLSWAAVPVASGNAALGAYNIWRSANPTFTPQAALVHQTNAYALSWTDTNLAAGTYYYQILAQDVNGLTGMPSNMASATVGAGGVVSTISVSPTSLSFTVQQGGANPANQQIGVSFSGAPVAAYGGSVTTNIAYASGNGWLSATLGSGVSAGTNGNVAVSVNTASLTAGTYNATISISPSVGSSASVPVTLTVTAARAQPSSLSINGVQSGSWNVNDPWTLSLTGAVANQPVYVCGIQNNPPATCTPAGNLGDAPSTSGSGTWSASGSFDSSTVGSWSEWIYVGGTGQVLSPGVLDGTKSNQISFTVAPVTAQGTVSAPTTPLSFTAVQGGPDVTTQSVMVTVSGSNPSWTATSTSNPSGWLVVGPTSGTTSRVVNVYMHNQAGLLDGKTYTGTVTISSPGNPDINISVTLTVSGVWAQPVASRTDVCGNGNAESTNNEQCDNGTANNGPWPATCSSDCKINTAPRTNPSCGFSASPSTVAPNGTVTLYWNCQNVLSCAVGRMYNGFEQFSPGLNYPQPAVVGGASVTTGTTVTSPGGTANGNGTVSYINSTTQFVIHCTNASATNVDQTTTVTVSGTSSQGALPTSTTQLADILASLGSMLDQLKKLFP
jgi:hypothetical protein